MSPERLESETRIFVPKTHHPLEDEAKRKLEELFSRKAAEPIFTPLLIGPNGETLIPSPEQITYFDQLNAEDKVLQQAGLEPEFDKIRTLSNRRQRLLHFLQNEEERIATGVQTGPSSYKELGTLFSYSPKNISRVLRETRISREGRQGTKEKECELPSPSRELAYFIGLLSASGQFNVNMTNFALYRSSARNKDILPIFISIGESLFKINASVIPRHNKVVNGRSYQENEIIIFNSSKATRFLGNLRKSKWPQTILEKHEWILSNQDYTWGLLEGYFDCHGGAYKDQGNRIVLRSSSKNDCLFILNILVGLGLKEPKLQILNRASEGVGGVVLAYLDDARMFAEKVHSRLPHKERLLEHYRHRVDKSSLPRISDEELIVEWVRLQGVLGHWPNSSDLLRLKKSKSTKYNLRTYVKRFGNGSFVRVYENLGRIAQEREHS